MLQRALGLVRRWPSATFLVVSCLWSWRGWLAALATGGTSPGIDPFGPLVAAVLVTAATEGRRATARLLRRLVQWRVAWHWYAFALGLPVVLSLAAGVATVALGAPRPAAEQLARWPELFLAFPVVLAIAGPLGEELGWRGFLLPRLRQGRSELAAALAVGVIWAGWHLPLLLTNLRAEWVPFLVSVTAASILFARLDAATGGSVLLAMLFHAAQNTVGGEYLSPMFTGADSIHLAWLRAGLYALAAAVATACPRPDLTSPGRAASPRGSARRCRPPPPRRPPAATPR